MKSGDVVIYTSGGKLNFAEYIRKVDDNTVLLKTSSRGQYRKEKKIRVVKAPTKQLYGMSLVVFEQKRGGKGWKRI